ncbi:MAG: sel1 repeat family protein [Deltaproteobacteria bacterium]|nr:sel1 repeat family protein [Deltaproteobacteria bacterium]
MRRALLLIALVACKHPAPQQPQPKPDPSSGCATAQACIAQADDALKINDIPKALDGLARACAFGDAHSCAREGVYLATNPQKDGDRERATTLLEKACNDNDALACEKLAPMKPDPIAAQLYDKACSLNSPSACGELARVLAHGTGTTADKPRAAQLAQKGCQDGAANACAAWGESYAEGWLGAPDATQARQLFSKACEQGDGRGCFDLAGVTTDPQDARQLRDKACANGYTQACNQ